MGDLFQILQRLLSSKNPDDLRAANRLIRDMVRRVSWPIASRHMHTCAPKCPVPTIPPPPSLPRLLSPFSSSCTLLIPSVTTHPPILHTYISLNSHTQDEKRMEKLKKRLDELETIQNNIKLLTELLAHYKPDSSAEGEKALMQVC